MGITVPIWKFQFSNFGNLFQTSLIPIGGLGLYRELCLHKPRAALFYSR